MWVWVTQVRPCELVFQGRNSWDRFWSSESSQSDKSDGPQILNHAGNICLQSKSGTFRNMLLVCWRVFADKAAERFQL